MALFTKMEIVLLVVVLQVFLMQIPRVYGRPGNIYNSPVTERPSGCTMKPEIQELCQQCAKHTKSSMVYPMCCDDLEEAQDFCRRYLDYGLH